MLNCPKNTFQSIHCKDRAGSFNIGLDQKFDFYTKKKAWGVNNFRVSNLASSIKSKNI